MANTITSQTILDGSRRVVVKIDILGDGSGDEAATTIVDMSSFTPAVTDSRLCGAWSSLNGFTTRLLWDATTDVPLISLPDYQFFLHCADTNIWGGIPNNAGAGKTGDINMTTIGLGAGDHGSIILSLIKD